MDWQKAIRAAKRAASVHAAELQELRRTIDARLKKLAELALKEREAAAWDAAKTWTPGDDVWCNAAGMFLGGVIQRGTHLTFWGAQPRKKLVWFRRDDGKFQWFDPTGLLRYDLRRTAPTDPVSPDLAQRMAKVGAVLDKAAGKLRRSM